MSREEVTQEDRMSEGEQRHSRRSAQETRRRLT
jgi:hypothetical protein